jgi:hypothetical protein
VVGGCLSTDLVGGCIDFLPGVAPAVAAARDLAGGDEAGTFRVVAAGVTAGLRVEEGVLGLLVAGTVRDVVGVEVTFLGGARVGVEVVVLGLGGAVSPDVRASEAAVGA